MKRLLWLLALLPSLGFGQSAQLNLSFFSSKLLSGGIVPFSAGGTGLTTITANDCLAGNSAGTAIVYTVCGSGGGSPGGSQYYIQFNNTTFGGINPGSTAGIPLISGGSSSPSTFGALNLSLSGAVSGTLPANNLPSTFNGGLTISAPASGTAFTVNGAPGATYGTQLLVPTTSSSNAIGFNIEQEINHPVTASWDDFGQATDVFTPTTDTQNFTGQVAGVYGSVSHFGSGSIDAVGGGFEAFNPGAATGVVVIGLSGTANNGGVTDGDPSQTPSNNGTAATARALDLTVKNYSSGAITAAQGIYINSAQKLSTGAITTNYGLQIADQTVGGTNYSIYTGLGPVHFGDAVSGTSLSLSTPLAPSSGGTGATSVASWPIYSAAGAWTQLQTFQVGITLDNNQLLTWLNSSGSSDAIISETPSGYLETVLGTANVWAIFNNSVTDVLNFGLTHSGAFTFAEPLYFTALPSGTIASCAGLSSGDEFVTGTCPGGSGTVNSGTTNQIAIYSAAGTAVGGASILPSAAMPAISGDVTIAAGTTTATVSKVNGASVPASAPFTYTNSGSQLLAGTAGVGLACSSGTCAVNTPTRSVSGTSDTILSTDNYGIVKYTSSSAVAVTLPQATGSFASGFGVTLQNGGSNIVTVTPTTSVINYGGTSGLTSLPLPANTACSFWSDGTNWNVIDCRPLGTLSIIQTSATSITPSDCYGTNVETASATGTFTINLPTGCTPYEGQRLLIRIISPSGGTVTYAANASYLTGGTTGAWPTTSGGASKMDDFQLIYTGAPGTTGWILEAYNQAIP